LEVEERPMSAPEAILLVIIILACVLAIILTYKTIRLAISEGWSSLESPAFHFALFVDMLLWGMVIGGSWMLFSG